MTGQTGALTYMAPEVRSSAVEPGLLARGTGRAMAQHAGRALHAERQACGEAGMPQH